MKGGHKKVIQLLENSSSTSSKSSDLGSKYLSVNGPDPTPKDYSPASTFETAVSFMERVKSLRMSHPIWFLKFVFVFRVASLVAT